MKKPISVRTKVEAVVLILLMIGISASAWTIKEGEDSTGQIYHGSSDLIHNSNGKAWTITSANLQSAIWDLNSSGGTVWVDADFTATSMINMEDNITIDFRDHIVTLGSDISFIKFADDKQACLRNVIIKVSDGHTEPVIELFSDTAAFCRRNIINNIRIINSYITKHNFTGLHLHVDDGHLLGNRFSSIFMDYVGIGIHFDVDDETNGWINGNYFEHIYLDGYRQGVFFDSESPTVYGANRNTFVDVKMQTLSWSEDGFENVSYKGNCFFDCLVWDWGNAVSGNYTWSINSLAEDTVIITTNSNTYILDESSDTIIMGDQGQIQFWSVNDNTTGTIDFFRHADGSDNTELKLWNDVGTDYLYIRMDIDGDCWITHNSDNAGKDLFISAKDVLSLQYGGGKDHVYVHQASNNNLFLGVFGNNATGVEKQFRFRYGSGSTSRGEITTTQGGVFVDDLILDTTIPANPEAGSCYFTTADDTLHIYNGSSWVTTVLT